MQIDHKKAAIWVALALGIGLMLAAITATAKAADLGGNCCTDLEERIAELEATTARKGNRTVTLTVYGQVNAGLLWVDVDDYSNTIVTQNGTDETFVGFAGSARFGTGTSAGYVLEFDLHQLGLLAEPVENSDPKLRQSYWWIKHENLGKLAVGRQATATGDFDKITTANTSAVSKPLSLGALSDAYLTGIDLPFDGPYDNVVRYDTPVLSGFVASASWGSSFDITSSDGNGDQWDVALRYAGEFSGIKIAGGLGYRKSTDLEINAINIITVNVPTGDVKTLLATGSVMHAQSGLFLTGNWADQDYETFDFKLKGWQATGGIEPRLFAVGKTTFYGEYGEFKIEAGGDEADVPFWGLGVVQAIDGAAMDLYAGYRRYDFGDFADEDMSTATAGARIRF